MASSQMKESGVEWIGKIPEDWEVVTLKRIATLNDESLSNNTPDDYQFKYVDIGSVSFEEGIHSEELTIFKKAPSRARRLVRKNDVIISTVRTYLKAIAIITEEDEFVVSTGFAVIRPNNVYPLFLNYAVKSDYFTEKVRANSYGVAYPSINASELMSMKVALPNINEQQKIAAFLDEKVAHIDNIIEETKKSIENLKAYKQSLITETVTKGLDPNVEMKESGVERIGKIPLHWKLTKLKYILSNEKNSIRVGPFGSHLKNNDFVEEGKWVYNQRIILDNNYNSNDTFITEEKYKEMNAFKVEYKDILLTTRGTIGKISRVPKQFKKGIIHSSVIKFKLDESKFTYRLLEYLFNESSFIKEQILQLSNATTIEVIYSNTLKNVFVPVPPLEEQNRIICFLDEKITKLNTILEEKEFLIAELESYKKSLIYEYVTGKKEVT